MTIVRTRAELEAVAPRIAAKYGAPLVQEYIPGGDRTSVQVVLDRNGTVLFAFHKLDLLLRVASRPGALESWLIGT